MCGRLNLDLVVVKEKSGDCRGSVCFRLMFVYSLVVGEE